MPKNKDIRESVFFAFAKADVPIIEMQRRVITLEDVFLKVTSDDQTDDNATTVLSEEDISSAIEITNPDDAVSEKPPKIHKHGEEDDDDGDSYRPLFG